MRLETTLNVSEDEVLDGGTIWLNKAINNEQPNWNRNRNAYIARLLLTSLQKNRWLIEVDKISQYYGKSDYSKSKENMAALCEFLGITHKHGEQCNSLIFTMVSILLIHLNIEGLITLRIGHKHHVPPTPTIFDWFYRRQLVSEGIATVYMTSTPTRIKFFWSDIPEKFRPTLQNIKELQRSSRQRAAMNVIEALSYSKVKSLDDITVKTFGDYFKANSELAAHLTASAVQSQSASTVTYTVYFEMFDSANGTSLQRDYSNLMATGKLTSKVSELTTKANNKNLTKIIKSENQIRKITCKHLDVRDLYVETNVRELVVLTIGEHTFTVNENRTQFRPEEMPDGSYWIKTQRDFLAQSVESSTRKNRSIRLSLLNSYLFDYLPVFFSKNSECGIKYPSSPSEFLSFVFVKRYETLLSSHFGDGISVLPVTLIDYVYAVTDEIALSQGYTKTNAGRDTIALIQRYFEFVLAKFSAIPECRINVNPISDTDKDSKKGYSYKKSVKELIELDYWVLLRMYLLEVSKAALTNAENVVFQGKENNSIFKVNKNIEWLEHKVHISNFNASLLPIFAAEDWKEPIKYCEYQGLLTLTTLAWSGLRSSNVRWLDLRSYARHCPKNYNDDDFVQLHVNTDKARTEPYESEIPGFLMRLLDRAASLRVLVTREGFRDPIPYLDDKISKWPNIKPLLQMTKSNGDAFRRDFLANILREFERCLNENNIQESLKKKPNPFVFESSLYTLPLYANSLNFNSIRKLVHAELDYTATLRNRITGESFKFTPVKTAVYWTPHSLRTTFDSVCSVLADPETVGKIATGQSSATVGYYSVCAENQILRIKQIQKQSGFVKQFHPSILSDKNRIATLSDTKLDKNRFNNKYKNNSLLGLHSLSAISISGFISPMEKLSQASSNEVAFNRTHVCPFNNICPREVISALNGEKRCADCPYAIVGYEHAIGISVELKRLGDICADLTHQIKSAKQLMDSEIKELKTSRDLIIKTIAGWTARHQFLSKKINAGEYFVGAKDDMIIKHMKASSSGNNLIKRLIETDGISTMVSPKLERESAKLNRKIMALANKNPEIFQSILEDSSSDAEVAIQIIKTICSVNEINIDQLTEKLAMSPMPLSDIKWINAL